MRQCEYPDCDNEAEHLQELTDGSTTERCDTHKLATDLLPPF